MTSAAAKVYDPLAENAFVRVLRAEVLRTPVLRVSFNDGAVRDIDFTPVIARSRWFRALAVPTTFEDFEIIHNGRALQWVTGADYCADALRFLADTQLAGKEMES
jgi:hypothetical protein